MTNEKIKYNEEDLFKKLAKPSFEETQVLYRAWWNSIYQEKYITLVMKNDYLKTLGWTLTEYVKYVRR